MARARLTRRNVLLTVVMVVWVPVCALACWWQITVALAGDSLGDLYSAEWPIFGMFGIVAWWRLIHDDPIAHRREQAQAIVEQAPTVAQRNRLEEDEDLEMYNDYLADLAARGRKSWRRS